MRCSKCSRNCCRLQVDLTQIPVANLPSADWLDCQFHNIFLLGQSLYTPSCPVGWKDWVSSAYPQYIGSSRFRRYNSPVWQACPLHHILHHLSLVQPVDGLEACMFKRLSENTFGPWNFPTWKIPAQTLKECAAYSKGFPEFSEATLRQVTWCKFLTRSFVSDFRLRKDMELIDKEKSSGPVCCNIEKLCGI